jgi:hypothetical protein
MFFVSSPRFKRWKKPDSFQSKEKSDHEETQQVREMGGKLNQILRKQTIPDGATLHFDLFPDINKAQ